MIFLDVTSNKTGQKVCGQSLHEMKNSKTFDEIQ